VTLDEQIDKVKKSSQPWERVKTSIEGVFIVKLPASKYRPEAICVELNPARDGKPTKRRGLYILSKKSLQEMRHVLNDPKLDELLTTIDAKNPKPAPREEIVVQM
jgi:predicted transcriptional regulator